MMLPINPRKQYQLPHRKFNCAENCMKKIWADFVTFNYNIGYFSRDQTFMYFQRESDLRKKYGNIDILTIKSSLRLGIFTKRLLVMTTVNKSKLLTCVCQIIIYYTYSNTVVLPSPEKGA